MSFADGGLINTDGPRRRQTGALKLTLQVEFVKILHRAVVQPSHLGYCLVGHITAKHAHMHGKALRIARVLRQPVKMFYMQAAAPRTSDMPAFELQVDSPFGNREASYPQHVFVVTPSAPLTTVRADRCFYRRRSRITRAYQSPKTRTNLALATKPGKVNRARMDLSFSSDYAIRKLNYFQALIERKITNGHKYLYQLPARIHPQDSALIQFY